MIYLLKFSGKERRVILNEEKDALQFENSITGNWIKFKNIKIDYSLEEIK